MWSFLRFTDPARHKIRRLTLETAGLYRSAAASGKDLKRRFLWFFRAMAGARRLAKGAGSGRFEYLTALETAGVRLQKTVLDMGLHGFEPDVATKEAFLLTAEALDLLAGFIARPDDRTLPLKAARLTTAASKTLRSAIKGARTDTHGFIPNLKFCTIYSDLEKAVDAVENCTELLTRMS